MLDHTVELLYFYSHTPRGVRPGTAARLERRMLFLLPHPSRGATDLTIPQIMSLYISTPTPLAGCDDGRGDRRYLCVDFYSHTPRGVRLQGKLSSTAYIIFLLPHPSRGATNRILPPQNFEQISTPTPLAGCDEQQSALPAQ